MRKRVECDVCDRRLRPAATDPSRCERCASEPVLHECTSCDAQVANYDGGRCPPCALELRLGTLRAQGDSLAIARLEPYLCALATSPNPWAAIRWMRHSQGYETLCELASGELECSHETLDALDRGQSTINLRAALVYHGVLPRRAEQAASFARAARRALTLLPGGEDRTHVRAFAVWQLHHHLLRRERRGETTRNSARYDSQRLSATVELALFAQSHGLTFATLGQHDLDCWLERSPRKRSRVSDFLTWAARGELMEPLLVVPPTARRHTDQLPNGERLALARRLLDDDRLELHDRVGGLLVLLFAQPVSRLLMLTTDHVVIERGRVTLALGPEPLELPERLGELLTALSRQAHQRAVADDNPRWLFAGRQLGAPMAEGNLRRRLGRLGIAPLSARTGALMALAATLPPAVLADLLGVSEGNAATWSQVAGGEFAAYAASRSAPRA
jgi:hypothetical protein